MKYAVIAVLTITALMVIEQSNAAPITITSSYLSARAYNGPADIRDNDNSTTFGSRTVSATVGANVSTTSANWLDTGSGALLDFDFEQVRDGARGNLSQTWESTLNFRVGNADTTYDLSGMFSATHSGIAGRVYSQVWLRDTSTGYIFRDQNYSDNTVNESFILGAIGDGDHSNTTMGSLSGTLLANREYNLYFNNYIYSANHADSGASATGCLTLSIGGATGGGSCGISVPTPAPLALFGLGLLALGIRRKYV